ncbi:MAG: GNAT family N-acetyltransferase [Caldilineaceae bacterium]|nr:GNAT family N-acetyltransferase [Caldilineaceae bacterium]
MDYRVYDPNRDRKAAHRIWRETGWIESEDDEKAMDILLSACRTLVVDLNGEPECLAAALPGVIRYQRASVRLSAVTAVTTSRIARKQGMAARLTASLIAEETQDGAAVSALGIFEQGFYNRLGYGNGSYVHAVRFDPSWLKIPSGMRSSLRIPARLSSDDWREIHHAMTTRQIGHGGCVLHPPELDAGRATLDQGWIWAGLSGWRSRCAQPFLLVPAQWRTWSIRDSLSRLPEPRPVHRIARSDQEPGRPGAYGAHGRTRWHPVARSLEPALQARTD